MIRALLVIFITFVLWLGAQAQFFNPPIFMPNNVVVPSCGEATTYLAALPNMPTLTQSNAFQTAICNMVTDGTFALLDVMYFFANTTDANAKINVITPGTYNATEHGTCTFTTNQGITGDASTCYEETTGYTLDTGGIHYVLNSGTIGVCVLNNRTTNNDYSDIGINDGSTAASNIIPLNSSGQIDFRLNSGQSLTTNTGAQGSWIMSRTASNLTTVYHNGSSFTTSSLASTAIPSGNPVYILALDFAAQIPIFLSSDQVGYALIGALSGAQSITVYNRLHTMMASLGNSAC